MGEVSQKLYLDAVLGCRYHDSQQRVHTDRHGREKSFAGADGEERMPHRRKVGIRTINQLHLVAPTRVSQIITDISYSSIARRNINAQLPFTNRQCRSSQLLRPPRPRSRKTSKIATSSTTTTFRANRPRAAKMRSGAMKCGFTAKTGLCT